MKYEYYLHDGIDVIEESFITKDKFMKFVDELKGINRKYNYSIYLYGTYVDYLLNKNKYYDISFIITHKKIMEMDNLTIFFNDFHNLCKKNNIPYNLVYGIDVYDNDINKDPTKIEVFTVKNTRMLRYYQKKNTINKNGDIYEQLAGTKLYEKHLTINNIKEKNAIKNRKTFPVPIKIE